MLAMTIPQAVEKPTVAGGPDESRTFISTALFILGSTMALGGRVGEWAGPNSTARFVRCSGVIAMAVDLVPFAVRGCD